MSFVKIRSKLAAKYNSIYRNKMKKYTKNLTQFGNFWYIEHKNLYRVNKTIRQPYIMTLEIENIDLTSYLRCNKHLYIIQCTVKRVTILFQIL